MVEKDEIHLEEDEDNVQSRPKNIEHISAGAQMIIEESNFKKSPHLNPDINETANTKNLNNLKVKKVKHFKTTHKLFQVWWRKLHNERWGEEEDYWSCPHYEEDLKEDLEEECFPSSLFLLSCYSCYFCHCLL